MKASTSIVLAIIVFSCVYCPSTCIATDVFAYGASTGPVPATAANIETQGSGYLADCSTISIGVDSTRPGYYTVYFVGNVWAQLNPGYRFTFSDTFSLPGSPTQVSGSWNGERPPGYYTVGSLSLKFNPTNAEWTGSVSFEGWAWQGNGNQPLKLFTSAPIPVVLQGALPTPSAYDEWLQRLQTWNAYLDGADARRAKIAAGYQSLRKGYLFMVRNEPPVFNRAFDFITKPGDDTQATIGPKGWAQKLAWKDAVVAVINSLSVIKSDADLLKAYTVAPAPITDPTCAELIAALKADEELSVAYSLAVRENLSMVISEGLSFDLPLTLSGLLPAFPNFVFERQGDYRPISEVLDDIAQYEVSRKQAKVGISDAYKRLTKVYGKIVNLDSWMNTFALLIEQDIRNDTRLTSKEKTDLIAIVNSEMVIHHLVRYLKSLIS